jgi:hypothetical protein
MNERPFTVKRISEVVLAGAYREPMKRFGPLILACVLGLGCQSDPEPQPSPKPADNAAGAPAAAPRPEATPAPTPAPSPAKKAPSKKKPALNARDFPPSLRPLYREGAEKIAASVKALPRPLQELRIERPFNKTRYRLDPRMLTNTLTNRLVKLRELPVVELESAPWTLESTISSEEVRTDAGATSSFVLVIELVDVATGKTLAKASASLENRR